MLVKSSEGERRNKTRAVGERGRRRTTTNKGKTETMKHEEEERKKETEKTRLIKKNEAEEVSVSSIFVSASAASVSAVFAVSSTTSAPVRRQRGFGTWFGIYSYSLFPFFVLIYYSCILLLCLLLLLTLFLLLPNSTPPSQPWRPSEYWVSLSGIFLVVLCCAAFQVYHLTGH